jgi:uncharacterized protein YcfJ
MKKLLAMSAIAVGLGAPTLAVQAEELARVISSTPIMNTAQVPREICSDERVIAPLQPGARAAEVKTVRTCNTVTNYESRPIAWNVVYEYAGKQYTMQTPTEPGNYVRLQITPLG